MRVVLSVTLILLSASAWATASNTIRHPVSSNIPCSGSLTEYATEGGNVHQVFQDMTLTCEIHGKFAWVIQGGVSCGELNDQRDMDGECGGDVGAPIDRFLKGSGKSDHDFSMVKYVFATNCANLTVLYKRLQAATNKVWGVNPEHQIVCSQVNTVDGTVGDDGFTPVAPSQFKFAYVHTVGAPEESYEDLGPPIANVPTEAKNYSLHYRDGKLDTDRTQTTANGVPTFPGNPAYEKVRESLLGLGWQPATIADRTSCPQEYRSDMCRKDWPEVTSCSGTGIGYCTALWKRGDMLIEVRTAGVEPASFSAVSCRANCP